MWKFALKRFVEAIPVLFAVVTITFFIMRFTPGGPFDTEKAAAPEVIKMLEARYNLNEPLYVQYFDYLKNVALLDFGPSFKFVGRSVTDIIKAGLPITFELGFYALLIALLIGISSGVFAALKKNTWLDYIPMSLSMFGICIPSFLLGPLLALVFAILIPEWLMDNDISWIPIDIWPPVSGWDGPLSKILPSITLGSAYAAYLARLSRGSMLEIFSQDFIRTARAKGVPEKQVIVKHALRGGLFPVVSFLGPAIAGLLAGSFVTETIFQVPGMGRFFIQAAFNRDYTMIMGTTVLFSSLIIFFNFLSDVALIWMNPKLKFEGAK